MDGAGGGTRTRKSGETPEPYSGAVASFATPAQVPPPTLPMA